MQDLSYGEHKRHVMDLYLPAGRTGSTPIIVLIHGGGWSEGNKRDLSFLAKRFQKKGFAVANINYRLSPATDDNYNMQLDDVASAVALLHDRSDTYSFSKNRFYTMGHSAGGHLALAYAYTRNSGNLVKAASGLAAPTNLHSMAYYNPVLYEGLLTPYLGAPLSSSTSERYKNASPYFQVNAGSVPTILFHGQLDVVVNVDQAQGLISQLKKFDIPRKLVVYPLTFHDWWSNGDFLNNTVDEAVTWFNKYR